MRKASVMCCVAALVGCTTTGGGGGGGGGGGVAQADFVQALVDAICGIETKCLNLAPYACRSGGLGSGIPDFNLAISSGRVKYDGVAAQGCVDYFKGLTCSDLFRGGEPAACRAAHRTRARR